MKKQERKKESRAEATNSLFRPKRPKTNMILAGVGAYSVDLAVMLSVLLQLHGYIEKEPGDLAELLRSGDLALSKTAVRFNPDCSIENAYVQEMDRGCDIGRRGDLDPASRELP